MSQLSPFGDPLKYELPEVRELSPFGDPLKTVGSAPIPRPQVSDNVTLPTQGVLSDPLSDFARRHPETQFDFTDLNTPRKPVPDSASYALSLQVQQALENRTDESDRAILEHFGVDPEVLDLELTAEQKQSVAEGRRIIQSLFTDAGPIIAEQAIPLLQQGKSKEAFGLLRAHEQQTATQSGQLAREQALKSEVPILRPFASGLTQSALSSASLLARVTDAAGLTTGTADALIRESNKIGQARISVNADMISPLLDTAIEGATRSLVDMFTLGKFIPGGRGPVSGAGFTAKALARISQARGVIGAFTAKATNEAFVKGKDAGLDGAELWKFAVGQGAIEGGITAAFQAVGAGGLETAPFRQAARKGFTQALKLAGIRTFSEVPEEVAIGITSALHTAYAGVDPNAATPENLVALTIQTIATTLLTMGFAESPGLLQAARSKPGPPQGPATHDMQAPEARALEQVEAAKPITDPRRLLMSPKSTAAKVTEALALPSSGNVIEVDPSGVAGTPAQQRAREQSAEGFVDQLSEGADQKLLAEPRARFYVGETAADTLDPSNPLQANRRQAAQAEGRIKVQKLTDAGKLKEAEAEVKKLRIERVTDSLTGEGNEIAWEEGLTQLQEKVTKSKKPRRFLWLDMRQFKAVNEIRGHKGGNEFLADTARSIRSVVGTRATVVRISGDEFGVIPSRHMGPVQAQKLLVDIEKAVGIRDIAPGITSGIDGGIGTLEYNMPIATALKAAEDMAMSRKLAGKQARGEPTTRPEAMEALAAAQTAAQPPPIVQPSPPDLVVTTTERAQVDEAIRIFREEQTTARAAGVKQADPPSIPDTPISDIVDDELKPAGPQAKVHFEGLEDIITPLSSRIYKRSRVIFRRVKDMMFEEHEGEERLMRVATPLLRRMVPVKGTGQQPQRELSLALMGTDIDAAKALLTPDGQAALDEMMTINRTLFDSARAAGVEIGELEGFILPREVRNYKKLQQHMGDDRGFIEKTIAQAARIKGRFLTSEEEIAVVNAMLRGQGPRQAGMRHAKQRRLTLTQDLLPFYSSFEKSQMGYIRDMVKATARAHFFGRSVGDTDSILDSAGALVYDSIQRGELRGEHQAEMVKLIHSFILGDMARVSSMTRILKQASYLSTLAQLGGAGLNQVADTAIAAYRFSLRDAAKGAYTTIAPWRRAKRITMEELGLHEYGIEWEDIGQLSTVLDASLRMAAFKKLDRLGKETQINAAQSFMRGVAGGNRNFRSRRFLARYKGVLSDAEMDATLADIRAGRKTHRTRFLHFLEITQVQPVDISEVPLNYAVNSRFMGKLDTRLFYTLKTFAFKQLDFVRRETVTEFAKGNFGTGARNLARFLVLWVSLDLGIDLLKDFIRGKTISPDQLPDRVVDSMLSIVGLNRYLLHDVNVDPFQAIGEYFIPPSGYITDPWKDIKEVFGPEDQDKPGLRFIKHIPVIGDQLYYRMGRGYYLNQENQDKDIRKGLKDLRSEAQSAYDRGDMAVVRNAIRIYNDRRREGSRQGTKSVRKTDLTVADLRRSAEKDEG